MVPIPELPPWISTVCRARRPAVITRLDHTVQVTSGRPAAVTRSTPAGTGSTCAAGAATFWA